MATIKQTAVLNTCDGDIRDVVFVANGELNVPGDTTNNVTNKGFNDPIEWKNITSITKQSYAAGVWGKKIVNFNSLLNDWSSSTRYEMVVQSGQNKRKYLAYSPVFVGGDDRANLMRDIFYNLMNQANDPNLVVTTSGDYLLIIEGKYGTDQVSNEDFNVWLDWTLDATELTVTAIATHADGMKITTDEEHAIQEGDYVIIADVTWTEPPSAGELSSNPYEVLTVVDVNNFTIGHAFAGATYGSGGTATESVTAIHTAYVEPHGTEEIVDAAAEGYAEDGSEYESYTINYMIPVASHPHGHNQYKEVSAVIYIDNTLESLLGVIDAVVEGTMLPKMVITGVSKADPAVITTSASHGLVAGDKIIIMHATVNPTILNGNVFDVVEVTAYDEFSVDYDSTGWTDPETSAVAYVYNPQKYYLGK